MIEAAWLTAGPVQKILSFLNDGGEEARVVGGAVRNHLVGEPVGDIDIATTCGPDETIRRADAAGLKSVPTGIDHGTVTIVADGRGYEVTTLRKDVETDGRRATVAFGRDWTEDANRRDFTVNALYCGPDGKILDPVGGLADIETRTIRFIGDAETRIREDYLRILRFFRFFARYGKGRPDAKGLMACTRLKEGLDGLSAERVWSEMRKLLSAPDPSRALLWMRQTGVLTRILPESEKWGIDTVPGLVDAERAFSWQPDPMLRLMSVIAPRDEVVNALADRWALSNAERKRLAEWAAAPAPAAHKSEKVLGEMLYHHGRPAMQDRIRLALVSARTKAKDNGGALEGSAALVRLLRYAEGWKKPDLPVSGKDLLTVGYAEGPRTGEVLRELEQMWIESGFALDRDHLLEEARKRL